MGLILGRIVEHDNNVFAASPIGFEARSGYEHNDSFKFNFEQFLTFFIDHILTYVVKMGRGPRAPHGPLVLR